MKKILILILILIAANRLDAQMHVVVNVNVTNERGTKPVWNYGFGVSHKATDGVDKELGEIELPPAPPEGLYVYFDYIYNMHGFDDVIFTNIDIKAEPDEEHFYIKHKLNIKWGNSKEIHINWNNLAFPAQVDSVFMMDALDGAFVKADMRQKDSIILRNNAFTVMYIHVYYSKNPASISDDDSVLNQYLAYPNPVDDILSIDKKDFDSLIVYSIDGRIIAEYGRNEVVSVKYLPKGLYFYLIDGIHYGKFLKN